MAEFVKGSELNSVIEKIFETAEQRIVIISPYIKLHSRLIEILKSKMNNPQILIEIVFGKNEDDITKSINKSDIEFLSDFPNIKIYHEPRLHAKYYSNEHTSVLSSMNLYDFSQNNNIEFGIVTRPSLIGSITGNVSTRLDKDAFDYFNTVLDNSNCLFERRPNFESKNLGLTKKYIASSVEVDNLSEVFNIGKINIKRNRKNNSTKKTNGFCIRTGKEIPFNIEKPLSYDAYLSWSQFSDPNYSESYCHFSGEESNGKTSVSRPILNKNWKVAKQKFNIK
jgi:hypothetical protein